MELSLPQTWIWIVETRFDFINRADDIHAPFRHTRLSLRRNQDLANRPPHVAFDGTRQLFFGRKLRIEIWRARGDARQQQLNRLGCQLRIRSTLSSFVLHTEDPIDGRFPLALLLLRLYLWRPYRFRW